MLSGHIISETSVEQSLLSISTISLHITPVLWHQFLLLCPLFIPFQLHWLLTILEQWVHRVHSGLRAFVLAVYLERNVLSPWPHTCFLCLSDLCLNTLLIEFARIVPQILASDFTYGEAQTKARSYVRKQDHFSHEGLSWESGETEPGRRGCQYQGHYQVSDPLGSWAAWNMPQNYPV